MPITHVQRFSIIVLSLIFITSNASPLTSDSSTRNSGKRGISCIGGPDCPIFKSSSLAPTLATTAAAPGSTYTTTPAADPWITAQRNPIKKGYVAFGDSYAAGIGTGTMEGSGCRQGEFSYPKQLASMVSNIDFQNYACSGAVTADLISGSSGSQIDQWQNPGNADIATLSVGGNDVDFFKILNACILRAFGPSFSGDCQQRIDDAMIKINGPDLLNDFATILHQIIDKSGRPDFKIYVTGYPAFFNVDIKWCDDVTFNYYIPHHRLTPIEDLPQPLTQDLRLQLNGLVMNVNHLILSVVTQVNQQYTGTRTVFVDPNPSFDTHRFCEQDNGQDVREPDSGRSDTWLFLSAWSDNTLPGDPGALLASEIEEAALLAQGNTTALPDPNTCQLSNSTDWADQLLCGTAVAASVPNSTAAYLIDQQADRLRNGTSGNLTAEEVSWFIPTRQAKTFHPKTLGHLAYRNAIMATW